MSDIKFLQFHTLTTYPATLLNRDDAGFAKRLPFGGVTRTRVSSQCLKYHWRNFEGENTLKDLEKPKSYRSRRTFKQLVAQPLLDDGYPLRLVVPAVQTLRDLILTGKAPTDANYKSLLNPSEDTDLLDELATSQVTIFGEPEVFYLRKIAREMMDQLNTELGILWSDSTAQLAGEQVKAAIQAFKSIGKKDLKKNLKGLTLAAGLEAAMFGRMATSDILARGDAAIHVAHSFTTHEQNSESDYFSAVDELKSETGELGGGHINSSELTSGLFYGYVVVDVPLLVSNLEGVSRAEWANADRSLAADVVEKVLYLIATVSPGAKLGSTAPYATAQTVLVEAGNSQPRTLANAFQRPVEQKPDVLTNTYEQLAAHLSQYDRMYGNHAERQLAGIGNIDPLLTAAGLSEPGSIPQVANWVASKVRG